MPFLAVLFMLAERRNLSHYREGIFLSTISDVDVDYVLRAPQMVQLRWIEMNRTTKRLLSDLANAVGEIVDKPVEYRELYHASSSMSQGSVVCWVDIDDPGKKSVSNKVWDITPEPV